MLEAAGIALAEQDGYEADDVIATLADRLAGRARWTWLPGTGTCSSSSTTRAASGSSTRSRGLAKLDVIDEAAMSAKYDIPGRAYADFAALRGDPSDGLPGVPGVGEKTAAALITAFGSIEGIRRAGRGHGGFPRGSREKLEKARGYLDVALSVVRTRPTCRCRRWTASCPRTRRTPAGWPSSASGGDSARR